ncbi:hypothetical protein [Actinomadura flavalba]|uniref:hypothetical protein n=1 Tax=Actinomadura flavalba TaxID=1120938 RepID=UPI000370EDE7|nr:hypothetical protein [Actinomadura flavalba]
MGIRDIHVIFEKWRFHCALCRGEWERVFEARHADDGHGGDHVAWTLAGQASLPPWVDQTCPSCRGLHVKALPAGTLIPPQR